ncbi:MAG: archaellum operon transcriptional activator EarA family protein [Candidatus Bathyarchaeia archaeon]
MSKKRSRLEIYLEVLETIMSGYNKPTNIMYRCNLSWIALKEILDSLVEKGLVTTVERSKRKMYLITEKGRSVVNRLEETYNLLSA